MNPEYINPLIANKKLIIVTWTDNTSIPQWASLADIKAFTPHKCLKTVGWVIHETDEFITIAANVGKSNFSHSTLILKINILEIQEIVY